MDDLDHVDFFGYNPSIMKLAHWQRHAILALLAMVFHVCAMGQSAPDATKNASVASDMKLLEGATTLAGTMTSWALVMIGGSILAVLGTGYYRPPTLLVRCAYLAFVPAWGLLSWSIYAGTRVQGVYLAALYSEHPNLPHLKTVANSDVASQMWRMELGLVCFGVWLTVYIIWWVFHKESAQQEVKPWVIMRF
jgi:hypothetical protein